ncbi:MAG: hypothetical protein AAGG68_19405 [Bacteroidota bacterium]
MNNFENKTIESILSRYNFRIGWFDDKIIIQSGNLNKSPIQLYLYFLIATLVLGIFSLFTTSIWIGIGLLSTAVPLFSRSQYLKKKEVNNSNKKVELTKDQISIDNDFETVELKHDDFDEISVEVERNSTLSVGTLYISFPNEEVYELLSIYGEDKRYVHDDAYTIANYLVEVLNSEN